MFCLRLDLEAADVEDVEDRGDVVHIEDDVDVDVLEVEELVDIERLVDVEL